MEDNTEKDNTKRLPINQETLDIIVANVIPTSKYFEVRFDHLESRVDQMQVSIKEFRSDVDKRFSEFRVDIDRRFDEFRVDIDRRFDEFRVDVDKRFEQVDKRFEQVDMRFEQVDKRFEQVDKRFEQVIASIDRLTDKIDNRDAEHRSFTLRMFSISIMISFLGVLGVFLKLFHVV